MKTNMITSGAIGLALTGLLFAGCSDSQSTSVSQYDATGKKPAVQTQAAVPVLETSETAMNTEPADYDFSDATVANVSYQQLHAEKLYIAKLPVFDATSLCHGVPKSSARHASPVGTEQEAV